MHRFVCVCVYVRVCVTTTTIITTRQTCVSVSPINPQIKYKYYIYIHVVYMIYNIYLNTHANLFVSYTNFTNNCKTHVQYTKTTITKTKKKKIPWGLKKICWGLINITVPRVSYKPHSISISIFSFNFPNQFLYTYLNLSNFRAICLIVFMLFVTIVVVFLYCLHLIHNLSRCLSLNLVSLSISVRVCRAHQSKIYRQSLYTNYYLIIPRLTSTIQLKLMHAQWN